jgi:hypothetical protein
MNMKMNMNNDQDKQDHTQVKAQDQARSQGQAQGQCQGQKQEQVSRLLTLITPPGQLHGAWTKFLIEVLSVLEEVGLIKRVSPEYKKYDDKYECIMRNLSRIRIVGPLYRNTQRLEYTVPFIRLSGLWLEKCGFFVGQRFLVYPKEDQLLLKKTYLCSDWLNKEEYEKGGNVKSFMKKEAAK